MAAETFGFRFKELDLEGALVSWNDVIAIRLARHAYLKRDGAEQEPMGAEAGRFTMRIALMGASWASNYRALVASIRQEPRGLLVHPLLGNLRVACTGISDASAEPGRAKRLLELTLGFEEDALDTTVSVETFTAPATAAARVANVQLRFKTAAAAFPTKQRGVSFLVTALDAVSVRSTAYLTAAQAAASGALDATLATRLAAVGAATDVAVEAVLADPASQGATAQPLVSRTVELYAACVQLDLALVATRPPVIQFTVPGSINLLVLAARLYPGKDATQGAQDILALNRIPNPLSIPSGTVLRLPRPTAA